MTRNDLKNNRRILGLNQTEMARVLKISRVAYVRWEQGNRRIPGPVSVAVKLLVERDAWVMGKITKSIGGAGL